MKKLYRKIKYISAMRREIKKQLDFITRCTDCVNLSVNSKPFKGFYIYNNSDKIAFLSYLDAARLLRLGKPFFNAAVYALCKKHSLDKF